MVDTVYSLSIKSVCRQEILLNSKTTNSIRFKAQTQ